MNITSGKVFEIKLTNGEIWLIFAEDKKIAKEILENEKLSRASSNKPNEVHLLNNHFIDKQMTINKIEKFTINEHGYAELMYNNKKQTLTKDHPKKI